MINLVEILLIVYWLHEWLSLQIVGLKITIRWLAWTSLKQGYVLGGYMSPKNQILDIDCLWFGNYEILTQVEFTVATRGDPVVRIDIGNTRGVGVVFKGYAQLVWWIWYEP